MDTLANIFKGCFPPSTLGNVNRSPTTTNTDDCLGPVTFFIIPTPNPELTVNNVESGQKLHWVDQSQRNSQPQEVFPWSLQRKQILIKKDKARPSTDQVNSTMSHLSFDNFVATCDREVFLYLAMYNFCAEERGPLPLSAELESVTGISQVHHTGSLY